MWWGLKKSDISLVFFFFFLFYNESMKRSGRSKGHVPLHRSPCFLFFSFFSFSPLYFSFYSTFIYFQVKEGGGSLVIYQNYQGLPNSTIFFSNFHRSRRFYLTSSITLFTLEPESTKAICFHSIHFFNFPQQRTWSPIFHSIPFNFTLFSFSNPQYKSRSSFYFHSISMFTSCQRQDLRHFLRFRRIFYFIHCPHNQSLSKWTSFLCWCFVFVFIEEVRHWQTFDFCSFFFFFRFFFGDVRHTRPRFPIGRDAHGVLHLFSSEPTRSLDTPLLFPNAGAAIKK